MLSNKTLLIIPARMASSRFPGKPLVKINGIAMLDRVFRIARSAKSPVEIFIATDSREIESFAKNLGAAVIMTSKECATGLDRAAEASRLINEKFQHVITLQGDAVLTPPWVVDDLIQALKKDQDCQIATPAVQLKGESLSAYVNMKKSGTTTGTTVVFDKNYKALYFSKTIIPHCRDYSKLDALYRHIGLYGYKNETLLQLASMPQSKFELAENLEQLRALENGIAIQILEVDYKGRTHASVDNPEDVNSVESIIRKEGELFL
jgi:3-deoxy-manno-octulosonate cytidylyltransferase (CMP-KDO synthetase)